MTDRMQSVMGSYLGKVITLADVATQGWSVRAVGNAYLSGPASRLPSVQAKADWVSDQVRNLDFEQIGANATAGSGIKSTLKATTAIGRGLLAGDLVLRGADVANSDNKTTRTAANALDFGGGLVSAIASSAAAGTVLGPVGSAVIGILGGAVYAIGSDEFRIVDLLDDGIKKVSKGVTAAIKGVVSSPSSWDVDAMGNPAAPSGFYNDVQSGAPASSEGSSKPSTSQGNGLGASSANDPRGPWQMPGTSSSGSSAGAAKPTTSVAPASSTGASAKPSFKTFESDPGGFGRGPGSRDGGNSLGSSGSAAKPTTTLTKTSTSTSLSGGSASQSTRRSDRDQQSGSAASKTANVTQTKTTSTSGSTIKTVNTAVCLKKVRKASTHPFMPRLVLNLDASAAA